MSAMPTTRATPRRRMVLAGLVAVVVVVVWLFAFFLPQSRRLTSLQSQRTTLQQTVAQDDARLQRLRTEAQHVGQIDAMYRKLHGDVPATEQLYTYIRTISRAAASAGVSITSLQPSSLVAATGTAYSAVPITAAVKGTYDHVLAFLTALYKLPRLTDVNSLSISGGGPGTTRGTVLSVSLDLAIFTSQKVATSG